MPIVLTSSGRPNRIPLPVYFAAAGGATGWQIMALDGTGYTTVAAMQAAGKKPWPSLPLGAWDCLVKTKGIASGGDAPGSAYQIAINGTGANNAAPTTGDSIAGNDYTEIDSPGYVNCIWVNLSVGTDTPLFMIEW